MGSMGEFLDVVGGGEVGSSDIDGAALVEEDRDSTCSIYGLYCAVASVKCCVFSEAFNNYRSSDFGVNVFGGISYGLGVSCGGVCFGFYLFVGRFARWGWCVWV